MPCDDCSRREACLPECLNEPPLTPEEEEEAPEDGGTLAPKERPYVTWEEAKRRARRHRPPYAVAYSVGGRAYEVLLPGDATATAQDGVLTISHPSPVLGIIRAMPVRQEDSADGAR